MVPLSKSGVVMSHRGFESRPLRQKVPSAATCFRTIHVAEATLEAGRPAPDAAYPLPVRAVPGVTRRQRRGRRLAGRGGGGRRRSGRFGAGHRSVRRDRPRVRSGVGRRGGRRNGCRRVQHQPGRRCWVVRRCGRLRPGDPARLRDPLRYAGSPEGDADPSASAAGRGVGDHPLTRPRPSGSCAAAPPSRSWRTAGRRWSGCRTSSGRYRSATAMPSTAGRH